MISRNKVLWIALLVYLLLVSVILTASLFLDEGHFIFALDDPYIHMSMAKNFAAHGNWATNNMDFTSASSSPLWVLLISAVYYLFGVSVAAPFILNILFQILSIVIAYNILREFGVSKFLFYALLAFVLITPMPAILFTGMEHSAQVSFALLFVLLSSRLISSDANKNNNTIKYLLLVTPILTGLRFECLFLVSVVSLLLLLRKNFFYSSLIFFSGILPIVIYGIISTSHGWFFLPNPILLKSSLPGYTQVEILRSCYRAFKNITEPHIFLFLIVSSFLYVFNYKRLKNLWCRKQVFLLIVIFTTILNMSLIEFHQNGWFYRYDAYLMALGVIAIVISVYDYVPHILDLLNKKAGIFVRSTILILTILLISPFVLRALTFFEIPFATKNIHDQHFQISKFVNNYASGITLAANDIGMIDFFSNSEVLDLYGLANMDVARDKLNRRYSTEEIDNITKRRDIKLAIVYENGYEQYGGLPSGWEKIGEWTMTDHNFVCGYETVTFFSVNNKDINNLRKILREFSGQLPESVTYKIF